MRSPDGTARIPCWQRRRAGRDPAEASSFGEPRRPLPHGAKDFLGLAFTAAIIGAILLFATNGLASPCRAAPGPIAAALELWGATRFADRPFTISTHLW